MGVYVVAAQLIETLGAGGAEALAVDIANALAARGLDSHLIVINGGGRFQNRVHDSVHIHDLESPACLGRLPARALYFARIHRKIAGLIAEYGINVIQTHLPKANFFGLTLAARRLTRVHPTVHNNREFDYGDNPGYLIEQGRRKAYWSMLRVNAEMIAVSPEVKDAIAVELGVAGTFLADRIVAISNGVICGVESSAAQNALVRAKWQIADDEILLVAAGRLSRQKNFSSLLTALWELPPGLPKWKCIIAGEGELREALQAQIDESGLEERVSLLGHVDGLREVMLAADIFCMSSIFEGLSLVMLEAMASGLPVCAFGIPGVNEVVTHGQEGLLAEPGSESEFAGMFAQMIGDESLRRDMGKAARCLVEQNYNFEGMIDGLVSMYTVG